MILSRFTKQENTREIVETEIYNKTQCDLYLNNHINYEIEIIKNLNLKNKR